jgi:hypothetical protein
MGAMNCAPTTDAGRFLSSSHERRAAAEGRRQPTDFPHPAASRPAASVVGAQFIAPSIRPQSRHRNSSPTPTAITPTATTFRAVTGS